ncbi:hypothetical protein B7463_g11463, partial [Scytalidium lignicola]
MKNSVIIQFLGTLAILAGNASAFYGQLSLDEECSEGCNTVLNILDHHAGSTYTCGAVNPSFCTHEGACKVLCQETSKGGYNWNAEFWQTSDGCHNINFEGAFGGAGHGYCCGGAPCNIGA